MHTVEGVMGHPWTFHERPWARNLEEALISGDLSPCTPEPTPGLTRACQPTSPREGGMTRSSEQERSRLRCRACHPLPPRPAGTFSEARASSVFCRGVTESNQRAPSQTSRCRSFQSRGPHSLLLSAGTELGPATKGVNSLMRGPC